MKEKKRGMLKSTDRKEERRRGITAESRTGEKQLLESGPLSSSGKKERGLEEKADWGEENRKKKNWTKGACEDWRKVGMENRILS